jgi:hypothetical protein
VKSPSKLSRRHLIECIGGACLISPCSPLVSALIQLDVSTPEKSEQSLRCVNVVNFIRAVEPRFEIDLLLPVQEQMKAIVAQDLPATWLLQYDALVSGPFVDFLKTHMPKSHEVGFWFEMNEKFCNAAKVEWRGRPGFEWDSQPSVAFTIGYTPKERIMLADEAMRQFKEIWGREPSSIASWNLDSTTLERLVDHYGIDAAAVCRDQISTDGFTIWGAPIAGYYPSKVNCWSPALARENQINVPIFRMLGQDPVYYYDDGYKLPSGRTVGQPDTMEPVWISGRSPRFIDTFLNMISHEPCLEFAYAQLGQENSFGWPSMAEAYPVQMKALKDLRDTGAVHVETMGDSGRRFKKAFAQTPSQAQIQLQDPFGNEDPAQRSAWYQSRFYRADLHMKGDLPYLRDLTVYRDHFPQPFLSEPTRSHEVEQRLPAVLDGFHWRADSSPDGLPGAGGFFFVNGRILRTVAIPKVRKRENALWMDFALEDGNSLHARFEADRVMFELSSKSNSELELHFKWDPSKAPAIEVRPHRVAYRWQDFEYSVIVQSGTAKSEPTGWSIAASNRKISLLLGQPG